MRSTPTVTHIVDTAGRDGVQKNVVPEEKATEAGYVMAINAAPHLVNIGQANVIHADLMSLTNTAVMEDAPNWVLAARRAAVDQLQVEDPFSIQSLLMSAKKSGLAAKLFRTGAIDELAFVHSHDPWVLWANSWIRKVDGVRIPKNDVIGNVDPDLAERMREVSFERYQAIKSLLESVGVPINVYQMNATGSRNRLTGDPGFVDPDVVLREMERVAPINGGRSIICDTEAIADPRNLKPLENLMLAASRNVRDSIGIHLHILNKRTPAEVQAVVRAALRPVCQVGVKDCFVETGVAGLGGCTAFDEDNQNAPLKDTVTVIQDLVHEGLTSWLAGKQPLPTTAISDHVQSWDRQLKALSA